MIALFILASTIGLSALAIRVVTTTVLTFSCVLQQFVMADVVTDVVMVVVVVAVAVDYDCSCW